MAELAVRNLATSLAWYRDVLGLAVKLLDEANGFALLEGDGSRLALKAGEVGGGVTLHFRVQSLDRELSRLSARGVVPDGPVVVSQEGYREAFVRDADGYRVGLFEFV
ncbi:VOC family protein [Limnoglobus roseus]|uniref:VOC family protein n=1 Tax=Limnoglobus roseus TaxID=2598579 RepID=A0A5C1AFU7_9BACT|nr:VOC family protein [Limnoglobus roseus]QEL15858.1 VOC family protein [Limnoglobus roseus]